MKRITLFFILTCSIFPQWEFDRKDFGFGKPSNFQAETKLYISSLSTPLSGKQVSRIDLLVRQLKDSLGVTSLSSAFDVFYIFANETQEAGLKNLVKRSHDATAVNTPTWTQYEGFTGASTKYVNTNYNPSSQAVNYSLNNASFGVYSRTSRSLVTVEMGAGNVNNFITTLFGGNTNIAVNSAAFKSFANSANSLGLFVANRLSATHLNLSINGTLQTEQAENSTSLANLNFLVFARYNPAGTALDNYSTRQISIVFIARGFTSGEHLKINRIVEFYMDSLNKGVQ